MGVDLGKLGMFGSVAMARGSDGCDILQFSGEDGSGDAKVSAKYRGWNLLGRLGRSAATEAANNVTRTKLLEALADSFGYKLERTATGKAVFSKDFMDMLEQKLGKDVIKRSAFGIDAHGNVTSGSPLTERRITAIVNAVYDISGIAKAEKPLAGLSGAMDGFMGMAGLQMNDRNGASLSVEDMAKVVRAFNQKGGDPESIATVGQFKELVETATGRTCRYTWIREGNDENALASGPLGRHQILANLLAGAKDNAEIFLTANGGGKRTTLAESVAAENRAAAENRRLGAETVNALRDELKNDPDFLEASDKAKANLERLLDSKRPYSSAIPEKFIRSMAKNMLKTGKKPIVVRCALQALGEALRAGIALPKNGSPTARLAAFAEALAQATTTTVTKTMETVNGYVVTHQNAPEDGAPPDFILDGGKDGFGNIESEQVAELLLLACCEQDPEIADLLNGGDKEALKDGLEKAHSEVSNRQSELTMGELCDINDDPSKEDELRRCKREISVLGLQSNILGEMRRMGNFLSKEGVVF